MKGWMKGCNKWRWRSLVTVLLVWPWVLIAQAEQIVKPVPAEQGLLWKIEPGSTGGKQKTSYLFGTMHSEHIAIVTLPEPVRDAFMQADRVILEVVLDSPTLASLNDLMQISDGPDLPTQIGQPLYRQTAQAVAQQGMPEHVLRTMKPWAAAMTLMVPKANTGLFLDRVLYLEALAKGKPVSGLESAAEQMQVFEQMSKPDQITLLQQAVEAFPQLDEMFAAMRAAYLKRDLKALVKLTDDGMQGANSEFVQRFKDRVIGQRNQRMLQRLQQPLQAGGAFVAVGALHLPNRDGLLTLLRQQGYKVTPIY